ncbi:EKC/KEOPS complex subunit TP53RK [Aplysia californica]|uniref:non-specific serine/threonine protein kinase n=1 Tax=Aplysia californica TaxID=6500 RepID=A0ABM0JGP5_APLCA|nr:EKC/KEOPS complex subunit TP53RK [Aplysia californica]
MNNKTLLKQGAEARLFKADFYGRPCIVKERFKKNYRHPTLDNTLTAQRLKSEVRANLRCRMAGILTPTVYMVNFENSSIYMELVDDAITVREHIAGVQEQDRSTANDVLKPLAVKIGQTLSKMHENNIIHGDLTTSNMLLKGEPSDVKLLLIDFGLSSFEASAEDKGVDLYVLERAFLSSHPNTQQLFDCILKSYRESTKNKKSCAEIISKLDEVRLRGRKRTMVG